MRRKRSAILWSRSAMVAVALAVLVFGPSDASDSGSREGASAKTWLGREAELEEFLRTVEPVSVEPIGVGVTNPFRAELEPGGPISAFAWKPLRPGFYGGFYESYKTEVAAYELDKALELGMVPVTVERRVDKELGAACMWASPATTFQELGGPPKPPSGHRDRWNAQMVRAKMFDNLIGNRDPNLGNWLVDPVWNILLIDHSRSFGAGKAMAHEFGRVDAVLWERMRALTEESLLETLGRWLNRKQIRSVLKRRDRMAEIVDGLIAERGEDAVLIRFAEPIH